MPGCWAEDSSAEATTSRSEVGRAADDPHAPMAPPAATTAAHMDSTAKTSRRVRRATSKMTAAIGTAMAEAMAAPTRPSSGPVDGYSTSVRTMVDVAVGAGTKFPEISIMAGDS